MAFIKTKKSRNKFDRKWFRENAIAVIYSSKSHYSRTFVVSYMDIDGQRLWSVDKERKVINQAKIEEYGDLVIL